MSAPAMVEEAITGLMDPNKMNNPNNYSTSQKAQALEKFKKDTKQMIGSLMEDQNKFEDFKLQV